MPSTAMDAYFRHLYTLLTTHLLSPEERQAGIAAVVQGILDALPDQPKQDQADIYAALYYFRLLPERRTLEERRQLREGSRWMKLLLDSNRTDEGS